MLVEYFVNKQRTYVNVFDYNKNKNIDISNDK